MPLLLEEGELQRSYKTLLKKKNARQLDKTIYLILFLLMSSDFASTIVNTSILRNPYCPRPYMQPCSLTQSKLKAQPHPQFVYMQPCCLTPSKLEA